MPYPSQFMDGRWIRGCVNVVPGVGVEPRRDPLHVAMGCNASQRALTSVFKLRFWCPEWESNPHTLSGEGF
jgi:hypothetical protein